MYAENEGGSISVAAEKRRRGYFLKLTAAYPTTLE
jgi:hypothetical protein